MKIDLERKIIDVFILDRERRTRKVIYHNPYSPVHLFLSDVNECSIKD